MSWSESSKYEDFFEEYFKTESRLLNGWDIVTEKDAIKVTQVAKSTTENENTSNCKSSLSNKKSDVYKETLKAPNEKQSRCNILEMKEDKLMIESLSIKKDELKTLNEKSLELNAANIGDVDFNDIKAAKSNEEEFEGYISNNKLKGRITKLNATRKRIKREKEERKKLASTLNAKEKRKLFRDKYFSELISRYHKQCIKNSWLTLRHSNYIQKELYSVLYNPSLENIESLLRKMDRMKIISYDGENITFLRLYRLRFENEIKDYEKLSLIVKKRLYEYTMFQYKTLITIWKHLRSEKTNEQEIEWNN